MCMYFQQEVSISMQLNHTQCIFLHELQATWKLGGNSVKICCLVPGGTAILIHMCCPESMGGLGDVEAKINAEIAHTGKRRNEVTEKV